MADDEDKKVPKGRNKPMAGSLTLDADKYREHVDDLNLTEEQKLEFLKTLWWIMSAFVDLGFRVDAVQLLLPALGEDSLSAESDTIEHDEGAAPVRGTSAGDEDDDEP